MEEYDDNPLNTVNYAGGNDFVHIVKPLPKKIIKKHEIVLPYLTDDIKKKIKPQLPVSK